MSEAPAPEAGPQRTDPLSFAVQALLLLPQMAIPLAAVVYSIGDSDDYGIGEWVGADRSVGDTGGGALGWIAVAIAAIVALNLAIAFLQWRRFTYRVGTNDIRVESGVLSRAARSVPYERIQDVSLEQKFVPRLFGLVEVRFETGAGGKDELKLSYLSEAKGEALRELVRERRDEEAGEDAAPADGPASPAEEGEPLFAMGPRRLFTFGLFEFSLAVVAVLGAAAQQFDFLLPFDIWEWENWAGMLAGPGERVAQWGALGQAIGALAAILSLVVVGLVTGIVRTFLRDWDFRLDRTAKGFRRRRGLFTRTDVVMPAHRVQALSFTTGIVRRRFGWRGLKFVSLAQDSGDASHVVAPFAKDAELVPIARAAGFSPPPDELDWHRASGAYRVATAIIEGSVLVLLGIAITTVISVLDVQAFDNQELVGLIPVGFGIAAAGWQWFLWRHERHALGGEQLYVRTGWLAPALKIGQRVKLQSVEIAQGPIARRFGFATLHLGLAGGKLAVPGIPLKRARQWRESILASIARTDFSELL